MLKRKHWRGVSAYSCVVEACWDNSYIAVMRNKTRWMFVSEVSEFPYPGLRLLRGTMREMRGHRNFVVCVLSQSHRRRLLCILPLLEVERRQLSIQEMLVTFFGLFRFMSLYFWAKGEGYRVQYEDVGELRISFVYEPAI
jgi:hypothetical protein